MFTGFGQNAKIKYGLFTRYVTKNYIFYLHSVRISVKNINFDDEINKVNFYKNKQLSKIDDIDVNKVIVSKKNLILKKAG